MDFKTQLLTSTEGRDDLVGKRHWGYDQEKNAVLLPGPLRVLPDVENLLSKGELHVAVIKMKDVATRPCVGFKRRGIYYDQAEQVRDVEKSLKVDNPIFLLVKAPGKQLRNVISALSSRLREPLIVPYASFYTNNPYATVLKMGEKNLPPDLSAFKFVESVNVAFDVDRIDQYFACLGSGLFAMDEMDIECNSELKQTELDIKLMTMPGADERMYLCFIDPAKLPVTLKDGGQFKIRFDGQVPGIMFPNFENLVEMEDPYHVPDMEDPDAEAYTAYLAYLCEIRKAQAEKSEKSQNSEQAEHERADRPDYGGFCNEDQSVTDLSSVITLPSDNADMPQYMANLEAQKIRQEARSNARRIEKNAAKAAQEPEETKESHVIAEVPAVTEAPAEPIITKKTDQGPSAEAGVSYTRYKNPHEWHGRITGNAPRHPRGYIAAIIYRPYDIKNKCHRRYEDDEEPKPISWKTMAKPEFETLFDAHPPQAANISVTLDRSVVSQIIKAAGELSRNHDKKSEIWKVIRNCGEPTHRVNLYENVNQTDEPLHAFNVFKELNARQRAVLKSMSNLPSSMVTIHGAPGCGKTFLQTAIVMPLLANPHKHTSMRQQCLFVCDTNRSADHTTIQIQTMADRMIKRDDGHPVVVIRVFSNKVEDKVLQHSSPYPVPRHPGNDAFQFDREDDDLLLSDVAAYFKERILQYYNSETTTASGIPDRRVTDKTVTLAYRMLQMAAVITDGPWEMDNERNAERFKEFGINLESYVVGELEKAKTQEFRKQLDTLRQATLEAADVVVGTPFCVAQHAVYSVFKPVVVMIDEAARMIEPLLWLPIAWYSAPLNPNLLAIIQVGDHYQTRPIITGISKDQVSYHQLRMSMMARLDRSDSALDKLVEQYRMHRDIADLVDRVFYHRTLITNQCTHHDRNPAAASVRRLNDSMFGKRSNLLAINLIETRQEWKSDDKSATNHAHVVATLTLLNVLLRSCRDSISAKDILILTPYRAQCRLYEKELQEMDLATPGKGISDVKVDTVDRFQGGESPIVLFDFVVTNKIGFMQEPGRLCTALSRAKSGLYLIGNFGDMNKVVNKDTGSKQFLINMLRSLDSERLMVNNRLMQRVANEDLQKQTAGTKSPAASEVADPDINTNPTPWVAPSVYDAPAPSVAPSVPSHHAPGPVIKPVQSTKQFELDVAQKDSGMQRNFLDGIQDLVRKHVASPAIAVIEVRALANKLKGSASNWDDKAEALEIIRLCDNVVSIITENRRNYATSVQELSYLADSGLPETSAVAPDQPVLSLDESPDEPCKSDDVNTAWSLGRASPVDLWGPHSVVGTSELNNVYAVDDGEHLDNVPISGPDMKAPMDQEPTEDIKAHEPVSIDPENDSVVELDTGNNAKAESDKRLVKPGTEEAERLAREKERRISFEASMAEGANMVGKLFGAQYELGHLLRDPLTEEDKQTEPYTLEATSWE